MVVLVLLGEGLKGRRQMQQGSVRGLRWTGDDDDEAGGGGA